MQLHVSNTVKWLVLGLLLFMIILLIVQQTEVTGNGVHELICKQDFVSRRKDQWTVLVAIISGTKRQNFLRRQAIRRTWATTTTSKVKYVFFTTCTGKLAEEINKERLQYNDMVFIEDLDEGYFTLLQKVLFAIQWASNNQELEFEFLAKVDDDTFVDTAALEMQLEPFVNQSVYMGCLYMGNKIIRDSDSRFNEPVENYYGTKYFLPYFSGGGYVISKNLYRILASVADDLRDFHNEDAAIGLFLYPYKKLFLDNSAVHVVVHGVSTQEEKMTKLVKICSGPFVIAHAVYEDEMDVCMEYHKNVSSPTADWLSSVLTNFPRPNEYEWWDK
eukprot:TRINITY_DN9788_c0_g1_i1.p1 TRINITY_DN9788_c0_g1~~TRINITY_DN9788_c0_g1_i1.p1  ORF type:complete len:331 (+),score=43.25 TRINITY_DN9788_c0_g1_i1:60-1052(+)